MSCVVFIYCDVLSSACMHITYMYMCYMYMCYMYAFVNVLCFDLYSNQKRGSWWTKHKLEN